MGILRNSIDITGITPENELPSKIEGSLVEHSDVDYIFIPGGRPRARVINKVSVGVEIKSKRIIKAPLGTAVIIDGVKNIKITYSPIGHSRRRITINLQLPYNTFFELPHGISDSDDIHVYVADAYFELVDGRKIYNYIFYMLDIKYKNKKAMEHTSSNIENESDDSSEEISEENLEEFDDELSEYLHALPPSQSDE